jgi:hypothetical protein
MGEYIVFAISNIYYVMIPGIHTRLRLFMNLVLNAEQVIFAAIFDFYFKKTVIT